ncbi:PEP-CTERM sorting domain-containing protein [Rubritalea profundi]|nr:PEP-CTERM sorting domain-containing protein [Rubritalea profundi]
MSLAAFALVTNLASSAAVTTVLTDAATWDYLHPQDALNPATADTDFNTTWYTQNDAGNSYNGPGFNDSGSGIFGYGAISNGTVTEDIGTPASGSRYTAYFVSTFNLGTIAANTVTDLTANILADDAAFVYINGQLAGGINIVGLSDTYFGLAASSGNEASLTTIALDQSLLIDGENSISVSVHQRSNGNTDLGFTMDDLNVTSTAVPEPTTTALLALGGLALILRRRR